jgi:hypothetical protein
MFDIEPHLPYYLTHIRIRSKCPHCKAYAQFQLLTASDHKINRRDLGSIFYCTSCNNIIFIKWKINSIQNNIASVFDPELSQISMPDSDLTYVPDLVKKEYLEALKCYGISCYNAFAAMSRRSIQAIFMDKNIDGTSKVKNQFKKFIEEYSDPEVEEILNELIITGHDGSHPHLPQVNEKRANLMLYLMNDLLEQIYNRPGKISEAKKLRNEVINGK